MFLENYRFKYPWRNYQANVLAELDTHMHDDKLNVVAAPGSGKTILGLEIVRRLNKNVLILSPTLTIKNQWIDRFLTLFVQDNPVPDFISTDIYNLNRFNVATYQGLHFAHRRRKIEETLEAEAAEEETAKTSIQARGTNIDYDLINALKANKIEVIVLDEAHHLRSTWWKSLTDVIKALDGVKLISLTATPPYDVEKSEWDKYVNLCGPVDCEISVPELVATDDLCPHQDYVIFNKLSREEEKIILDMQHKFQDFAERLLCNRELIEALASMPELTQYTEHEEKILENPKYYSSLLIFLHAVGETIDKKIVRGLGGGAAVPSLNMEWLEIMLQGILFDDQTLLANHRTVIETLRDDLTRIGGAEKKSVTLQGSNPLKKLMASSIGKMDSIVDIATREYAYLQEDLSMIILTDYIRREALGQETYNKIGVVPIFQKLIQTEACPPAAILTGSLKVIPVALIPFVQEKLPECEFNDTHLEGYVSIKISDRYKNQLVGIITQAVIEKKINIVVGTVALLGEGWDCPAVNSLVMASSVGSFMLSNQMRGRAIRRSKTDPNKVANIWHLVSITRHEYKRMLFSELELSNYHILQRRFQGFVGIAYTEDLIQNGLERLEIVDEQMLLEAHEQINERMFQLARDRAETRRRWKAILALFGGEDIKMVNTLQGDAAKEERLKTFAFYDLQSMMLGLIIAAVIYLFGIPALFIWMELPEAGEVIIESVVAGLGIVWQLYFIVRLIGHYNPVKNMQNIGDAVLAALQELGAIQTQKGLVANRIEKIRVNWNQSNRATLYSAKLHGATVYENNLYIKCVQEIYRRIDNPRYVLMVKNRIRISYFNVPGLFANNKGNAEMFYRHWKRCVGTSKLVYTRSAMGRRVLLDARKGSFDYDERFFERKRAVRGDWWR
ncbi:MAG: DEAD/DEAH box helicase family protein [Defluviitaleaceae bacterium]|nr:DEAD/DEAH box helicase family protein [Defluviitaleaceae bacterium]